ncbi:hypothetical protein PG993_010206 [Apiospora rasikravindrae]|uniref:Uncharacterized protein n=1 Tax=Apiospora rasikravindrae TaxID=990691 RepID=A0ABR1SMV3_9PEZI
MAPNDKKTTKKQGSKKEKKPRGDGIDYRGDYDFDGTLGADNKTPATGGIKNSHHCIASHISSKHKEGAAYVRDQKNLDVTYHCYCGYQRQVWNNFLAHIRQRHGFKGNSNAIKEQKHVSASTEVDEQGVKEEDEELNGSDFDIGDMPDDHPPHQDPKDDDKDGGRGPGGAASGLIQAAA